MGENHPVIDSQRSDLRRNPDSDREEVEIDRLLQMAAYYQRLGCLNVATSLRALADAKRTRRPGGGDDEGAV